MTRTWAIVAIVVILAASAMVVTLELRQSRSDETALLQRTLARLDQRLAELEARAAAGNVQDLDRRVRELSDELRSVEEAAMAQRAAEASLSVKSPTPVPPPNASATTTDGDPTKTDAVAKVDPYGVSVPSDEDRRIRAIYGRIKEEERQERQKRDDERRDQQVRDRVDQLAQDLNLSGQQKPAVEKILLDEAQKRSALFRPQDDNLPGGMWGQNNRQQFGEQMRQINEQRDAALQTVLDFDQMKKFRESDNQRGRFFGGGGPGGGGGRGNRGGNNQQNQGG